MLHILLFAGAVGFPFSLNLGINDSWVADGWRIEEVARISLADYAEPLCHSNGSFGSLVKVYSNQFPSWRVIIAGSDRVVLIEEGEAPEILKIVQNEYVLKPVLSDRYVLIQSGLNDKAAVFRYSFETGECVTAVANRSGYALDCIGYFESLMGDAGQVYFTDYEGYVGGYSDQTGLIEYDASGGEHHAWVFNNAVSEDGNLYCLSIARSVGRGVLGFNLSNGFLWEVNMHSAGVMDISSDGAFVAVDKVSDGIVFLDGDTGRILNTYLSGCLIRTLALSPNGRYIAASIITTNSSDYAPGERRLSLIDTQAEGEIESCRTYSDCGVSEGLRVNEVTDHGVFLVENFEHESYSTIQYLVYDNSGNMLWRSTKQKISAGLIMSLQLKINTLSSMATTEDGYIVGYFEAGSTEIVICRIVAE